MSKQEKGILAVFDSAEKLLSAIEKLRQSSFSKMEAFTPFPVHGIEKALGLKRSWIPYVTIVMGLTGALLGFALQAWTSAVAWPLNVGGKPFLSWPAFIPITFEAGVLIGGVSTVLTLFLACRLPNRSSPPLDLRFTDDHFGLLIERDDPYYDEAKLTGLLGECHAVEIKPVENKNSF